MEGDAFGATTPAAQLREHFDAHGYVLIRELVPRDLCRAVLSAFRREVKPSSAYFVRHKTGMPERHAFTAHGHMKYPIMNPHELWGARYGTFRNSVVDAITCPSIVRVVTDILHVQPKLIHTMLFEGNQQTWPHRDGSYLDGKLVEAMVGIWIALEEIAVEAGRFYIYPDSHRIAESSKAPTSDTYVSEVAAQIRREKLACFAPALQPGDAFIWSSRTIHGSLATTDERCSRACLTGHFVSEDMDTWFDYPAYLLKSARRVRRERGLPIHFHADQDQLSNRIRIGVVGRFPGLYRQVGRVKGLLRR